MWMLQRPGEMTPGSIMRLALMGSGRGWRLAFSTAGFMTHQMCEAAVPILIGVVIDRAIVPRDAQALLLWVGVLAAVFVVLSISYQRAALGMVRTYGHAEHEMRQIVLARLLDPRGVVAKRSTGEVLSITTSDTYRVAGVTWSVAGQGAVLAAIVATSVALLLISVPLGLAVLVGSVIVLVGMHALARPIERLGMAEQSSAAGASEIATDAMAGLRIVHGLGAQREMSRRYAAASTTSRLGAIGAARSLLTYEAVSTAVSAVFLALLALAAAWMTREGTITPGELITVVGLAQFVQGALGAVGFFGANWLHKRASARRVHRLVAQDYSIRDLPEAPDGYGDAVRLRWRIGRADIVVPAGALVGVEVSDAAHARQIADRLAFRTAPAVGEIVLDGADVVALGPHRYRESVTAPPHDAAVFSGSLGSNVGLDRVPLDPDLMTTAALDDVLDLLGGPDAELGEQGRRLSGGQRQRVLLARALHDAGEVLVLTEPTTALDPVTEQRVATALAARPETMIVLTSSPLLLAACDQRVVAPAGYPSDGSVECSDARVVR